MFRLIAVLVFPILLAGVSFAEPVCGDGEIDVGLGETCDGLYNPPEAFQCRDPGTIDQCTYCGDGILQSTSGEDCDDGNVLNGDGCSEYCMIEPPQPVCGNGIVEPPGEECDDGNIFNGDSCDQHCRITPPVCGNGLLQTGEECDDGNIINGDGCDDSCLIEPPNTCGDGVIQTENGETCDGTYNPPEAFECRGTGSPNQCTYCGDGIQQATSGEDCDDGNVLNGDGCSEFCRVEPDPICGNRIIEKPFEECDDGNSVNGDGCDEFCMLEIACDGPGPRPEECFCLEHPLHRNCRLCL